MPDSNRTKLAKVLRAMTYRELQDFCDDIRLYIEGNTAKEDWAKWPSAVNAWAENAVEDPQ